MFKPKQMLVLSLVLAFAMQGSGAVAADRPLVPTAVEFQRLNGADNIDAQVRKFVANSGLMSGVVEKPTIAVKEMAVRARMLTPLNSQFNFPGDSVSAEVVSIPGSNQGLPAGTVLHGFVESIRPSARISQDAEVTFKFYSAEFASDTVDLTLSANGNSVEQQHRPPSKKQKLRQLLTFSARLSIPLALGTSGTSLAITTGACALVSAALCDDGHYVRAAARGAWEGSGLSILDPLVQKGVAIVIPEGATVELALAVPAELPEDWLHKAQSSADQAMLSTKAQLLTNVKSDASVTAELSSGSNTDHDFDVNGALGTVQAYLDQKNMARALQAMDTIPAGHRDDPCVRDMRAKVRYLVTGESGHD